MPRSAAPVLETERVAALDVLRGVAVLGILLMNIQSFSMPMAAYLNPTAYGSLAGAGWWVWLLSHTVADRKFISIFSMLFGAGVCLFASRAEARGESSRRLHYRRMSWLLLFGLAHAHLLWFGDILFSYAVCGMLIFPLRRLAPRTLLAAGLAVTAVASALYILFGLSIPFWPSEAAARLESGTWRPAAERIGRELAIYRSGWLAQFQMRFPHAFFLETQYLLIYELWRAGGLMIVGMALYKWGVLTARRSRKFYGWCVVIGLAVGIPAILYGVLRNVQAGWSVRYSFFFGPQWNYWASIPVALAWVALVMLASQARAMPWLTSRLAAVGRTAFSNYILQTVLCTLIFYGHGAGLYGRVPRSGQLGIVVAIWIAQLAVSPLWLRRFHFGPLEWLWRSLTYGARQPLLRR